MVGRPPAPRAARLAPSPPRDPLLGHIRFLQGDATAFFLESVQKYGDVVRFHFGPVTGHLIAHPEHVRYAVSPALGHPGPHRSHDSRGAAAPNGGTSCCSCSWMPATKTPANK
jgi:hypothetical protein